jgi:hypothetical protein
MSIQQNVLVTVAEAFVTDDYMVGLRVAPDAVLSLDEAAQFADEIYAAATEATEKAEADKVRVGGFDLNTVAVRGEPWPSLPKTRARSRRAAFTALRALDEEMPEPGQRPLVGDADFTPDTGPWCGVILLDERNDEGPHHACTSRPNHEPPHVSGDGQVITAVWS